MIKEIKIDNKTKIPVNSGAGWYLIYRSQFGHDILPDLLPMVEALVGGLATIVTKGSEDGETVSMTSLAKVLDSGDLYESFASLSGLEVVTVINIVWAMAKNANSDIPSPETWINQYETFPLDVIVPQVVEMIIKGSVSTKNWIRLQSMVKDLKTASPAIQMKPSA